MPGHLKMRAVVYRRAEIKVECRAISITRAEYFPESILFSSQVFFSREKKKKKILTMDEQR